MPQRRHPSRDRKTALRESFVPKSKSRRPQKSARNNGTTPQSRAKARRANEAVRATKGAPALPPRPRPGVAQRPRPVAAPDTSSLGVGAPQAKVLANESKRVSDMLRATASQAISSEVVDYVINSTDINHENIIARVNFATVAQYLWGIIMRPMAAADGVPAIYTATCVWEGILRNFVDMQDTLSELSLPRPIWELRCALMDAKVGKYTYSPDWTQFGLAVTAMGNNGPSGSPFFGIGSIRTSTPVTGFNTTTAAMSLPDNVTIARFLSDYSGLYDLCTLGECKTRGDASAYAFDVSGPVASTATLASAAGDRIMYHVGFDGNGTGNRLMCCYQDGVSGLEVPIRNKRLAALRLCTEVNNVVSGAFQGLIPNARRPLHCMPVNATPSLLGFTACKSKSRLPGVVQLKPVPAFAAVQDIINKLEAVVVRNDVTATNTLRTAWLAAFQSNEIKILAFSLFKSNMRAMSGALYGTGLMTVDAATAAANMVISGVPEYHAGLTTIDEIKVPESINRALNTQSPYSDNYGTLLPWYASFDPNGLTTMAGYLANTITIPATEDGWSSYNNLLAIIAKYRSFESALAQFCNLSPLNEIGDTLLDFTALQSTFTGSSILTGFRARRRITPQLEGLAYRNVMWLGYSVGSNPTAALSPTSYNSQEGPSNKEYSQFHTRVTAGLDTKTLIAASCVNDGVVLNGFVTNITDATGSGGDDRDESSDQLPLVGPVNSGRRASPTPLSPPGLESLSLEGESSPFAEGANPGGQWYSKGNYCGPGWTAGERGGLDYTVKPTDAEDAVCKKHDAAYGEDRSIKGRRDADITMVVDLLKLRREIGLSPYGYGMLMAIGAKAGITTLPAILSQ